MVPEHRTSARVLPLAIAALALAGCGAADGARDGFAVRDSAGIEIVENSAPAWESGSGWSVAAEPSLEIGMVDGPEEYQLANVTRALRAPDGRVLVANGGSREVRFYGADGRYLRSVGREGGGPGEFQALNWISFEADSLLVWDPRAKRLSVFTEAGEFVRSVNPPALASSFFPMMAGVFADGSLLLSPGANPMTMAEAPAGEVRETRAYLRVGRDGAELDTLATLPGAESWLQKTDRGFSVTGLLFGRESYVAAAGDRLFAGDNDRYEIRALDLAGATTGLIRRAHEPVAVGDADLEALREERMAGISGVPESARAGMSAMLREVPHRPTRPAFSRMIADDEGNLWIEEFRSPAEEEHRWSVFDPDGRWLGVVHMPAGLRVLQIGSDFVLGTWKDDLDVQYVRIHPLHKSAR